MGTTTEPAYLRVLEDLRSRIDAGLLEPGARVPSRNAIITHYGVGETAAKHALAVLLTEGLIEARPGSGCYVRKAPAASFLEHDRPQFPGSPFGMPEWVPGSADLAAGQARAARRLTWEHQSEHVPVPPPIGERLSLAHGAAVIRTTYLLRADGEPVQLATSYEPAGLTRGTAVALPEQGPLAGRGVIERMRSIGVQVDEVTEEVTVRSAHEPEATALAAPARSPVLVISRTHLASQLAVETADVVVPADRFRLRYRFPVWPPASPESGAGPVAAARA
jgi:DNA-binding GntR family transcriptional regulator